MAGAALALPPLLAACGADDSPATPAATGVASAAAGDVTAAANLPQGSGEKIKIGFIALTDCASVVMAKELGYFKKYGLDVDVVKQASWASTRDALLTGDIQAAHMLFGMPFSVYTGVGGTAGKEIMIAMTLNNNGQAITLSNPDFGGKVGYKQTDKVKAAVDAVRARKEPTFAMTFPGGTHDMWLRYWLAAANVSQKTVKIITIPPPQMVANMKVDAMDGFCVGEPWGGVAVKENIGFTAITTQDIWKHHPEKALGVNAEFATKRRGDLKLMVRAILEASQYIEDKKNIAQVAKTIGTQSYVNAPSDVIDNRLEGKYALGKDLGDVTFGEDTMRFYRDGQVNFPRYGHAMWFMAQYVRFGYLKEMPSNAKEIAQKLIMQGLYKEVAAEMKVPVPNDDMTAFTLDLDKATFDPNNPAGYLAKYGNLS
ncbi:MAG: nitrate ABC transporter substrate-binding protein [Dehalococcoidia bacterium]|nr:MAG: nitrate ABC transporter substrate-binding protein [Dehalococcoidia bacterium]